MIFRRSRRNFLLTEIIYEFNEKLGYCNILVAFDRNRGCIYTGERISTFFATLPGIYVRPGKGKFYVFDHIEVLRLKEDRLSVILQLSNRTAYNANVTIFAETDHSAAKAMGYTAFSRWPKVFVPFGKEITVKVWADGKVSVTGKEKSISEKQ